MYSGAYTNLFSMSSTGFFFKIWINAWVQPKKENNESYYRLIALVSHLESHWEKAIHIQLIKLLEYFNIFIDRQYGDLLLCISNLFLIPSRRMNWIANFLLKYCINVIVDGIVSRISSVNGIIATLWLMLQLMEHLASTDLSVVEVTIFSEVYYADHVQSIAKNIFVRSKEIFFSRIADAQINVNTVYIYWTYFIEKLWNSLAIL